MLVSMDFRSRDLGLDNGDIPNGLVQRMAILSDLANKYDDVGLSKTANEVIRSTIFGLQRMLQGEHQ